jgi:DNA-binding transcriptional LysR family regulator
VIISLVAAGLGVALMREDIATAEAAKRGLAIWGDTRLQTPRLPDNARPAPGNDAGLARIQLDRST